MRPCIALLSCLLLAGACGGDDAGPAGDTRLVNLDDADLRTFCETVIANDQQIDARIAADCPGRREPHTRTIDDCVLRIRNATDDCAATVERGESCLDATLADACTGTLLLCQGFGRACGFDIL
jgi:hypothetical protein